MGPDRQKTVAICQRPMKEVDRLSSKFAISVLLRPVSSQWSGIYAHSSSEGTLMCALATLTAAAEVRRLPWFRQSPFEQSSYKIAL